MHIENYNGYRIGTAKIPWEMHIEKHVKAHGHPSNLEQTEA